MGFPDTRPRLAVIVANGITGDSRVQKAAIAAARDGWDVTLVGRTTGKDIERSSMGPIDVIRVPVKDLVRRHVKFRQGHRYRRVVTQIGIRDKAALDRYRAVHRAWVRRETVKLGQPGGVLPAKVLRKGWIQARELLHQLRSRGWGWEEFRRPEDVVPTGDWRHDWAPLVDLDLALGPVIEELEPDLIHANDITMINTAAQVVARLRARGRDCAWLYDAHEYVRGVDWPKPSQATAFPGVEREFIGYADAVVTVSPEIAELLRADYRLAETPLVVRNVPIRETVGIDGGKHSVREACGLSPDVPLMVYSGWISAERGLGTAVGSLAKLPDVHLGIVSGRMNPELSGLLERAEKLGVRDRVHVVPYVPQHAVPDYLSSADLGLICSQRTLNYELSLPTKLAEYLHGGVPVVASDVKTLRAFVERNGVGEVFRADDVDSFSEAVTRALGRRQELAGNIAEPVLKELSWEHQSAGLLQLYRKIAPRRPASPRPDVPWTVEERPAAITTAPSDKPVVRRWKPLAQTRIRLGVGPANYAGQAAAFAQAVCQANPFVSAEVFMYRSPKSSFDYPADVYLDSARLRHLDLQVDQVRRVVGRYTHLVADAFRPVFGYLNGENIESDLPALRTAGVKVALLAHGSEVRHPGRHLERHEYSHFRDAPQGLAETLTKIAERNRRVAEESGLPLFVTTPDLLDDLPWAKWTPLVVDVQAWACERPVMSRKRPVVLHAPSARWTKGTDRILPVLNELHEQGVIEVRLAEKVTWSEMREMIWDADLVVDQFTTGAYGTLACEAMAAGRPVVAYVSDSVARTIGADLPIINATPATLRKAIEARLDDRDGTVRIGAESVTFAQAYHGGAWTARVLGDFLQS